LGKITINLHKKMRKKTGWCN